MPHAPNSAVGYRKSMETGQGEENREPMPRGHRKKYRKKHK